jgi:hypothetical protein
MAVPAIIGAAGTLCTSVGVAQRANWQTKSNAALTKASAWSAVYTQAEDLHNELKSDFVAVSMPLSVVNDRFDRVNKSKLALDQQNNTTDPACYALACDQLRNWDEGNPAEGIKSEKDNIKDWIDNIKNRGI